jgi:hypothetical protein
VVALSVGNVETVGTVQAAASALSSDSKLVQGSLASNSCGTKVDLINRLPGKN